MKWTPGSRKSFRKEFSPARGHRVRAQSGQGRGFSPARAAVSPLHPAQGLFTFVSCPDNLISGCCEDEDRLDQYKPVPAAGAPTERACPTGRWEGVLCTRRAPEKRRECLKTNTATQLLGQLVQSSETDPGTESTRRTPLATPETAIT